MKFHEKREKVEYLTPRSFEFAGMDSQIEVIKIPTLIKVWKRGPARFNGVITDLAVVEYLRPLAIERKKVTVMINGMELEVRLLYKVINGRPYVLFFLPKSLNPTWERLNEKGEIRALVTIMNSPVMARER
jgi:hypothetical protein